MPFLSTGIETCDIKNDVACPDEVPVGDWWYWNKIGEVRRGSHDINVECQNEGTPRNLTIAQKQKQ